MKESFALSGCHFHANPEQLFMRQCRRKIAFLDVERDSMENNKNNISKYLLSGGVHRAFSFVSICIFFVVIDITLGKANQNTSYTVGDTVIKMKLQFPNILPLS